MLMAICYREAGLDMLEAYKDEMEAGEKLAERGNLKSIFSALLVKQDNTPTHYAPSFMYPPTH